MQMVNALFTWYGFVCLLPIYIIVIVFQYKNFVASLYIFPFHEDLQG